MNAAWAVLAVYEADKVPVVVGTYRTEAEATEAAEWLGSEVEAEIRGIQFWPLRLPYPGAIAPEFEAWF